LLATSTCPAPVLHPERYIDPATQPGSERDHVARLEQAIALLRPKVRPDDRILTLAFANPYPAAFGTPSVPGAMTWWHYGRTFDEKVYPPAQALLRSATLIIVAKPPDATGPALWNIYGATINREFAPVGENAMWVLLRRVVPNSSSARILR
jgi:hypothetical protein